MQIPLRLLTCGLFFVCLESVAQAQNSISDTQVRSVLNLALDKIDRAVCGAAPCAPATAAEKSNPPLDIAEARIVLLRGVTSGIAEKCGLNWQERSFVPMMQYWRQTMKKNERQRALVGMIHGIGMSFSDQASCSPQMRENVDRQLNFKP